MSSLTIISSNGNHWYDCSNEEKEISKKSKNQTTSSSWSRGGPGGQNGAIVKKTRSAARLYSKIKYDVFVSIAKQAKCTFWNDIFTEIACENIKKGFRFYPKISQDSFSGGKLVHKQKTKEQVCVIPEVTNETISNVFEYIKNFIITKTGILSEQDRLDLEHELLRQNEQIVSETSQESNWNKIRGNNRKFQLIFTYVYTIILDKHPKIKKICQYIENTINIGIISGYISAEDITLTDGVITNINGILINEEEQTCELQQNISNPLLFPKNILKICNTLFPQSPCISKKSQLEKMIQKLSTADNKVSDDETVLSMG